MLDKNTSLKHECGCGCTDCTCGKRNRFFRGKRMKADDFEIEQLYSIERRRIINRSVIGTGVVNGFQMWPGAAASVEPGFAIDELGREIVLAHAAKLGPDNLFLVATGASGCRTLPLNEAKADTHYLLSIHYAERRYGDADVHGGCGCEKPEKNYLCETGVFSLTEVCEPCPCGEKPCDWHCECRTAPDSCDQVRPPDTHTPHQTPGTLPHPSEKAEDLTDRTRAIEEAIKLLREDGDLPPPELFERVPQEQPFIPNNRGGRGPHGCLCHRLMEQEVDCSHPALCDWNGYFIDPKHGVALACVTITRKEDKCDPVGITVVDPCGPRHFIKSNELLYDFIRGCDLTHISWVSWHAWHRRREMMPWQLFASLFYKNQNDNDPNNGKTAFVVRFSAPVCIDTIRYDSVVMRAITIEQPTDWRLTRRIPIVRFDYAPHDSAGLIPGTTDQIRIYVSPDWIDDEIHGKSSWLTGFGFEIEFELDGFGILDCHRQPIDAEAIGLEAFPTGNGSPGGMYRSAFRVLPKPHRPAYAA